MQKEKNQPNLQSDGTGAEYSKLKGYVAPNYNTRAVKESGAGGSVPFDATEPDS